MGEGKGGGAHESENVSEKVTTMYIKWSFYEPSKVNIGIFRR